MADDILDHLDAEAEAVGGSAQNLECGGGDLRPNAVAGQHYKVHATTIFPREQSQDSSSARRSYRFLSKSAVLIK
jgi:hypothetical protein